MALTGSTAFTALVGRIPIQGHVQDPFPFYVLVGADNLAANGLELPEVAGVIFRGTALGDWIRQSSRTQPDNPAASR